MSNQRTYGFAMVCIALGCSTWACGAVDGDTSVAPPFPSSDPAPSVEAPPATETPAPSGSTGLPGIVPSVPIGPKTPVTPETPAEALEEIAFAGFFEDGWEIYTVLEDGSNLRRLTNDPARDLSPSWSADGRQIAFASDRSGSTQVHVLDIATTTASQLTHLAYAAGPAFAPDGMHIAFQAEATTGEGLGIFVAASNGSGATRVTDHTGYSILPTWSSDSSTLVFSSSRSGAPQIFASSAAGSNLRPLSTGAGIIGRAAMSPDGSSLALQRNVGGVAQIELLDLQTSATNVISNIDDSEPTFSSSGTKLAWTSQRSGGFALLVAPTTAPGSYVRVPLPVGLVAGPTFRPKLSH